MKAKMLKLAGVKSEAEFYKKFPTEEAFMKVHSKHLKKAQFGDEMPLLKNYTNYSDYENDYKNWQTQSGMTPEGGIDQVGAILGQGKPAAKTKPAGGSKSKLTGLIDKAAPGAIDVIQGIGMLRGQKQALKSAEQMQALSDITLQATRLIPEQRERRYLRPEDNINTGEPFFPIYGVGTNPLAKNGTEIANTFAPNTIYDDLGYEPLHDSERVKQFFTGGKMKKAADGDWLAGTDIHNLAGKGLGDKATGMLTNFMGESAGGKIGSGVGKAAGTIFGGPVGGMIGQFAGTAIGGLIDRSPQKIKRAQDATNRNIMASSLNQGFRGAQKQYTSFMEDGGNVNPQIISKFGNYSLEDLLAADSTMDTLRVGGHLKEYTAPTAEAMSTERPMLEQGGELAIHWGGDAEPISQNPYLPDGGETIMFRGQSHDDSDGQGNTGIGITYGQSPVEVERGEPAVKLRDGGNSESLVVFGNLKVPNSFVPILGEEAKGKKFKNYVADLSKKENKQNKIIDKSSKGLENLDMNSPFDKLTLGSYKANIMGANMKLKDIAQKKMDAGELQNAMNTMMEYEGLEAGDDGMIKAKKGAKIPKADIGANLPPVSDDDYRYLRNLYEAGLKGKKADKQKFQKEYHRIAKPYAEEILAKETPTQYAKDKGYSNTDVRGNEEGLYGPRTDAYMAALKTGYNRGMGQIQTVPTGSTEIKAPTTLTRTKASDLKPATKATTADNNKFDWMNLVNQTLPYLRPTDAERLDANQLAGEMFALSQNQLEPVQAQLFQPELNVPYDISLQDIINENQADFRSQQRMVGYNPAAQGILNAQKYAANQKVLGEQFRMNQAQKQQVYNENRALLNQARLQNLGILDTQYQRQAAAKSATKATTQAALNSIADKYAKNRLEGRTLQAYENLYNYRFDPSMRTVNMNPLVDFESMIANATPAQLSQLSNAIETKSKAPKKENARNGSIVKALKNL